MEVKIDMIILVTILKFYCNTSRIKETYAVIILFRHGTVKFNQPPDHHILSVEAHEYPPKKTSS